MLMTSISPLLQNLLICHGVTYGLLGKVMRYGGELKSGCGMSFSSCASFEIFK